MVHDVATLWWLLQPDNSSGRPLVRGNCVRGGARNLKNSLTETQKLISAISAFIVGVKVRDDLRDGGGTTSKVLQKWYARAFDSANNDLQRIGFDMSGLNRILQKQDTIENSAETDFRVAAQPTEEAYNLLAGELAARCDSPFTPDQARSLGTAFGRSIYLADALNDFPKDRGKSYNPLCAALPPTAEQIPSQLRHRVLTHMSDSLAKATSVAGDISQRTQRCVSAVNRSLLSAAGVNDQQSVTLYGACCIPCGNGAVIVDGDDCKGCFDFLSCSCVLLCCTCGKACQ